MQITATLVEKSEIVKISATFQKREFIVEYAENPEYPELVKFELNGKQCGILENFEKGEILNISFNLKGRKWTNKKGEDVYFNTLQAWKIQGEKLSSEEINEVYEKQPEPESEVEKDKETTQKGFDLF